MPIVATAGHVDHGKSTLVEALTGRDPDRWAEEKERGLTIDLGFAWADIGGHEVGFVDVPGHERFIKNMLAGIGGLDVALFVVAADEGWMPQSEEHLAVLDLLDTRHGVIALTRIDLTDMDTVDLAEVEILEAIDGTALEGWPIVRVSPIEGTGMAELREALATVLTAAGAPPDNDQPRLWVDRSFHISGAGLVVTGTLVGGTVTEGEDLMLWPDALPIRVRGLQRHDSSVASLAPGTRAALNITGADAVARGDMLGRRGAFDSTTAFLAHVRPVRGLDEEISSRGAFHLHVGSGSWPVRLRVIGSDSSGVACLLRTGRPIPLQAGDRLIVRETGRRSVVAGGRVLDPRPPSDGRELRAAVPMLVEALNEGPDQVADALLRVRGTTTTQQLFRDSGGGTASSPFRTGDVVMAADAAEQLLETAVAAVAAFHQQNRLRPGIPKASLISSLGASSESLAMVVAGSTELTDEGATVRHVDFEPGLTALEQQAWDEAKAVLRSSMAVPRASQLGLDTELLHALVRDEQLVRVTDDLVFLPEQIAAIHAALQRVDGEFTVAEFRDLLGVTRRQAVPLLEWLDKQGITTRKGDTRVVRD
jgi:selenocysteine-specific elongation factor